MTREYHGLLADIAEAVDLQHELGCTPEEASAFQRELAAERLRALEPSNVIPFRCKH